MTVLNSSHIAVDDHGVAWIDNTNVKAIEVVTEYLAQRSSPEEMQRQHPDLSVAQIHAALAHYYDHQAEFDAQIERTLDNYRQWRAQAADSPIRAKLRSLGHLP